MNIPLEDTSDIIARDEEKIKKIQKYSKHAYLGVRYLLKQGYGIDDIKINTVFFKGMLYKNNIGSADITTVNDYKNWEVKIINESFGHNDVIFTIDQIRHMNPETDILIFRKNQEQIEPVDILKLSSILCDNGRMYDKYQFIVAFNVTLDKAIEIINKIRLKDKDMIFDESDILSLPKKGESITIQILDSPKWGYRNSSKWENYNGCIVSKCRIAETRKTYFLIFNFDIYNGIISELKNAKIESDENLTCIVNKILTIACKIESRYEVKIM